MENLGGMTGHHFGLIEIKVLWRNERKIREAHIGHGPAYCADISAVDGVNKYDTYVFQVHKLSHVS